MDDSVPKSAEEATTEDEEDDTVEQSIAEEIKDTVVDQEIVSDGITKMKKTFSFSDGTEYKPPKVKRRGKFIFIQNSFCFMLSKSLVAICLTERYGIFKLR